MFYYFILIFIGPLLLLQGRHVRKVTPILAEPSGGRSGRLGEGRPLTVLVIGDSAAAGVGVMTQDDALSGCLSRELAQTYSVSWSLVAKSGNTTLDLIDTLLGQSMADVDVVLVSLGVNDLLSPLRENRWIEQQARLITLLKKQCSTQHILMTAVPPMHLFPAFPQPLRWFLGLRAKAFNHKLNRLIEHHDECELVEIPLKPAASDMASDGFHPGPKVYRIWGSHVARVIERRVSPIQ
ncbi:SGNH/GDSL hydrolase family protein [Shewanella eurypsychrophilus]|uniref:SGNH/GDSL hydrolase family protein n=1 Tax=Shewanella eurypsychrophilus TaxID=2593656 RepID=A0ABX6V899_9GAMM|nr:MULTISPECIES: SGNH/GDSL hydrolase family protein [Shewanella]QFU23662.1 SGNH/GDSL hydrolase family protein [Shewanella sp. YLB-09]QPG58884.1 SGNH/GDSL hydrolase family protein [Shewanella eurypsychrophilus]